MPEKTQRELIQELHQSVHGVPGTVDRGLAGDVKDLVKLVIDQNDRVRKGEQKISKIWGILIGVGTASGIAIGIGSRVLMGW